MKKIHICLFLSVCFLTACSGSGNSQSSPEPSIAAEIQQETHGEQTTPTGIPEHMGVQDNKEEKPMRIQIESETVTILCELNDSQAAADLVVQLPLTTEVENFSTNEKTFYPPENLDISDAQLANAEKGTLAYYSPWADVVLFYDHFGQGSQLYELGQVIDGIDEIEALSGTITITVSE